MTESVSVDLADGAARIRLTNGTTNVLTTEVIKSFSNAVDEAASCSTGLLVCGGDKFFSNGVDVEWALGQTREEIRTMFLELGQLMLRLLETPVPVVGAIRGHAIGAAKSMFLACDYRFGAIGRGIETNADRGFLRRREEPAIGQGGSPGRDLAQRGCPEPTSNRSRTTFQVAVCALGIWLSARQQR